MLLTSSDQLCILTFQIKSCLNLRKNGEEVLISLEDNQKRKVNNNDGDYESDSDLKDNKKLKKNYNLNDEPRIFFV